MKKIKCKNCNVEHEESTSNCCWLLCECGERICGQCGSVNITHDEDTEPEDEHGDDQYWCCEICEDCGLGGCAMCI